ncbi:MAG TPA: hypothetical protein VGM29_19445, partial [Polyangiaceae bacterium]
MRRALLPLLPLLAACAGQARVWPHVAPPATPIEPETSSIGQSPRLFPPLRGSNALAVGSEPDGSRRFISYGLRVIEHASGALELGSEYLPSARSAQILELPERLGGGFLIYVLVSNETLLYRAKHFTAALEPFARLGFEAQRVVAGFDRLYVFGNAPGEFVALDADRGSPAPRGSLPPAPFYGKMAFADAWFGAVETPLRGTLVSFDAGESWRALPISAQAMDASGGQLLFVSRDGVYTLNREGAFGRRDAPRSSEPSDDDGEVSDPWYRKPDRASEAALALRGPLPHALALAVTRGQSDGHGNAVVAAGGALARVRLGDGAVIGLDAHAYVGAGDCQALALGKGVAFACSEPGGQTGLYQFVAPLSLQRLRRFADGRYVASNGAGALVVRGGCADGVRAQSGLYCIVRAPNEFNELEVRGDRGVERVVALGDGRSVVIVPPRLGTLGFLSIVTAAGTTTRVPLQLPKGEPSLDELLLKGLWLEGFQQSTPSTLSGWVAGGGPFVGVRIALDGKLTAGTVLGAGANGGRNLDGIERTLVSGRFALAVAHTGAAAETSDGGFIWSDVELPPDFDATRAFDPTHAQGCSALGCAFSGFVRVGWRSQSGPPHLPVTATPDETRLPSPGGGAWNIDCVLQGAVSEPSLAVARRHARGDEEKAAWEPFLEAPAPQLGVGEVGYDTAPDKGAELAHAYVWGQRGADWSRAGHLQIRAFDRFAVKDGLWSSAPTRSPWPDAGVAAETFGYDNSGSATVWSAVLEAGGRAGALVVSARGTIDVLLFEEGRPVSRLQNAGRLGLAQLSSVVKLGDAWYVTSHSDSRALTVLRIEDGRVERIGEYADVPLGRGLTTSLV